MRAQQATTQPMKISEVKRQLRRLVSQFSRQETRILIEKRGIPVAAIVWPQDLHRLEQLDRDRTARFKTLEEFAAGFADQSSEEIEQETARAIAEVRARRFGILNEFGEIFKDGSVDELEREVARALAEVRARRRTEPQRAVGAKA